MIYVFVNDKWHVQVASLTNDGDTTACGLALPFGAPWTRKEPAAVCRKCAS